MKTGLTGKATPSGYPEMKISARLAKLSAVPIGPGTFEARIALDFDKVEGSDAINPGMACATTFVAFKKDDALTLPAASVFTDDADDSRYVYLPAKEGKPTEKDGQGWQDRRRQGRDRRGPEGRRRDPWPPSHDPGHQNPPPEQRPANREVTR